MEYDGTGGLVVVPLWMSLGLVGVPTVVLWWRDRRRIPPGHCRKCGYNLTGNVSGVCPECGTAVAETRGRGDTARRPAETATR